MRLAPHRTLIAAVALPGLLAAWYAAAALLPRLAVPAPRHDLILLSGHTPDAGNALRVELVEGRAAATFIGENFGYGWPRLFRFHAATGRLEEIALPRPANLPQKRAYNRPAPPPEKELRRPVPLPELETLRLDPSAAAPDGYAFIPGDAASGPFRLWRGQGAAALVKQGRRIVLPAPDAKALRLTLLGWVRP